MMAPHIERMEKEHSELVERIDKLSTFLDGETFATLPEIDQELLKLQREAMGGYLAVLEVRLRFAKKNG